MRVRTLGQYRGTHPRHRAAPRRVFAGRRARWQAQVSVFVAVVGSALLPLVTW